MGATGDDNAVSALIARLERVIQERQGLIEAVEAAGSSDSPTTYWERLAALTREQRQVLVELVKLVPPKAASDASGDALADPPSSGGSLRNWAP